MNAPWPHLKAAVGTVHGEASRQSVDGQAARRLGSAAQATAPAHAAEAEARGQSGEAARASQAPAVHELSAQIAGPESGQLLTLETRNLPEPLRLRLALSAALEHDYSGLPLSFYTKADWHDVAQWLNDVLGEPTDEQQVIDEAKLMVAKSECWDRWMRFSDATKERWTGFDNYWAQCGKPALEMVS